MKTLIYSRLSSLGLGLALACGAQLAHASLDLAQAKHCTACHAPADKRIGPSFKAISAKYAGDRQAAARLALKVQRGGVGTWGQIPMPANPHVSAQEAQALVQWMLSIQ